MLLNVNLLLILQKIYIISIFVYMIYVNFYIRANKFFFFIIFCYVCLCNHCDIIIYCFLIVFFCFSKVLFWNLLLYHHHKSFIFRHRHIFATLCKYPWPNHLTIENINANPRILNTKNIQNVYCKIWMLLKCYYW